MTTVYYKWQDVPDGLKTQTQLRAERLKPAPDQKPAAQKRSGRHSYNLYDRADAVPLRPMSQAQEAAARQNIEKARQALCCVDCGSQVQIKRELQKGRCDWCYAEYVIQRDRLRAIKRFGVLAGQDDWLVVDTETTGLGDEDEIVSVAVVSPAGEVLFSEIVRPTIPISRGASAVNGFTDEMVAAAPPFAAIYPRLAELLTGRRVLAYNADFDRRMLAQTCSRYGLAKISVDWECVMELYAAARNPLRRDGSFTWCKLAEACEREGVKGEQFHEACADAQATRMLVLAAGKETGDAI